MAQEPEFIEVIRALKANPEKNEIAKVEPDFFQTDDVREFRDFKRTKAYDGITGDLTQLTVRSGKDGGFFYVTIQENFRAFAKRIGRVIPL